MKRRKNKKYEENVSFICFVLLVLITLLVLMCNSVQAQEKVEYREYTVQSGDTLWNIACNMDLDESVSKTVYTIRKDNNNLDPILQVGQVIKIREVK